MFRSNLRYFVDGYGTLILLALVIVIQIAALFAKAQGDTATVQNLTTAVTVLLFSGYIVRAVFRR